MLNTYQIPVSSVGKIISAASDAKVAPREICLAVKLDLSVLEDVDNQIPFKQLIDVYRHAAQLTGDDAFGLHVGERDNPKLYGILGYVAINSRTVGEAFDRLIRFQWIRTEAYEFSLEIVGSKAQLAYIYKANDVSPLERRHESEETLCSMIKFGKMMTGVEWTPLEVHFEHARPENVSEHERIFRAPVLFDKPVAKLIFDKSFLELTLIEADLTLGSLLERQAEELLAASPRHGVFVRQVRQLIEENLREGEARIETICRKLGRISKRTLQRKLSEEGTSYQELLEETQCDVSKFYLQKPEMAICEVSYLVGFSQPSAFHRAFRRWTGTTPKEFRDAQPRRALANLD